MDAVDVPAPHSRTTANVAELAAGARGAGTPQPLAQSDSPRSGPGSLRISVNHDWTVLSNRRVGNYLSIHELKVQVQAQLQLNWRPNASQSVAVSALEQQIIYQAEREIGNVFSNAWGAVTIRENEGLALQGDGGNIGIGLQCEFFRHGSVTVRFNPVEVSRNRASFGIIRVAAELDVASFLTRYAARITAPIQNTLRAQPFPGPSTTVELTMTAGLDIALQPNWSQILLQARSLFPTVFQMTAEGAAIAGAAVTIAVPLLVGAVNGVMVLEAFRSGERTRDAAVWAQNYARGYMRAYVSGMTGEAEPTSRGPGYQQGFAHGQRDAATQMALLLQRGQTTEAVHRAATSNYDELRRRVFEAIRTPCIRAGQEMAGRMDLPSEARVVPAAVDDERPRF